MDIKSINTHNLDQDKAFEILCNQIFENWLKRNYPTHQDFIVVNGDGGDGGVESYTTLSDGSKIANQVKWFMKSFANTQVKEIEESIEAAMINHPEITKYVIFIPRDLTNSKVVEKATQKTAKNTDYSKTEAIKTKYQAQHKGLTIEFFGEHQIIKELQEYENIGIRKFWFEDSIIHMKALEDINEKSLRSWLKVRYVSDLYRKGFIEEKIQEHLYNEKYRLGFVKDWKKIISLLLRLEEVINKIPAANSYHHIKELLAFITEFIKVVKLLIEKVNSGERYFKFDPIYKFDKDAVYKEFDSFGRKYEGLVNSASRLLNEIDINGKQHEMADFFSVTGPKYLVFSGPPGSGKTQALASLTKDLLELQSPAIVIQAKYRDGQDLRTVLQNALSGFDNWSEMEILQALEALAHIYEVERKRKEPQQVSERVKVLISIDGVEEAKRADWGKWKNLINSLSTFCEKFPRIQFVITCREYFLENIDDTDPAIIYQLPFGANVPVVDLFEDYVNAYNAPNDIWLKTTINSPLALKLFCSIYQDKRGADINFQTSLTGLIKAVLSEIQNEVSEEFPNELNTDPQIFLKVVDIIAANLSTKETITENELKSILTNSINHSAILISHILVALERHGILKREEDDSNDGGLVIEVRYRSTNQSYIDFLVAKKLAKFMFESGTKKIPDEFLKRSSVLQIATNILLKDYGIEIGVDGIGQNIGDEDIKKFVTVSIGELDKLEAGNYIARGVSEFKSSVQGRNRIFNSWIYPAADNASSPFNGKYLHDILTSFKDEFERDKIWSGPANYDSEKDFRISDILSGYQLSNGQKFDGMPLVFAWSLTTVDNIYREYAKTQLTNWAYHDLGEFNKLIELLFGKYDAQMDEDLALIILGVASIQMIASDEMKVLSLWIDANVFTEEKIKIIKDALVRHCCRAFQERAFTFGLIGEEELKRARPPYNLNAEFELVPLYIKKTTGSEGQIFPIVHDLAWYVIKESYDGFLEYDSEETEIFLNKYSGNEGVDLKPFQFAIYAGLAYIKKLGYDQENGPGLTEASHGSLSKISTFEEKYTWLAVNYIKGYLADNVPFDNNENGGLLDDYSKILKVKNPANDIKGDQTFPEIASYWIVPQTIAPPIESDTTKTESILKNWVQSIQEWDFKAWTEIQQKYTNTDFDSKDWLVLDNDTTLSEQRVIGQVHVRSTAIIIEDSSFSLLLDKLKMDKRFQKEFDPIDNHYTPDVAIYISPIDVIWMDWIKETESSFCEEEMAMRPTTCQVLSTLDNDEIHYLLPSREIREWLGVKKGNGEVLLNQDEKIVGYRNNVGENYSDRQQMLIVDKEIIEIKLKEHGLKMIWSVFVFQKAQVDHPKEIYKQDCQMFVVWNDNGEYKSHLYHQGHHKP